MFEKGDGGRLRSVFSSTKGFVFSPRRGAQFSDFTKHPIEGFTSNERHRDEVLIRFFPD